MSSVNNPKTKDETDATDAERDQQLGSRFAPVLRLSFSALLLVLLGALVYRDFVFGDKVLLYKEVGSDSLNDYFPTFAHVSDYLRNTGLPSWSFSIGMGQNLFYLIGYLVLDPVVWLPKAAIPEGLVFQHLAKLVIAGLLFMKFLQLRGLRFQASLAGALLLSFSAFMCIGSCWIVFADEVVCFTFALFAVEAAIRHGRWVFITFAVALTSLITVFHLYLCAVLLSFYLPFRLIELFGWKPAKVTAICAKLATAAVLGIGLASITCLDNAYAILNSPRGSGTIATSWTVPALFHLESASHYVTAILRAFSNDIWGTGNVFRGWGNYLEAPINYCGLFCLIMLPQAFGVATRRQRILYGGLLCFMVLPVIFPWLRHLFWLFQGGYYRTLSLFSIFGVITLSMTAFSRYIEGSRLNLWTLGATLVVLLGFLYAPTAAVTTLIDHNLRLLAAVFLLAYGIVLVTGQIIKQHGIAMWAVLILVAAELIYFDRTTVSSGRTVTKQELKDRVGYNDETIEAIRDIKAADSSFFRIRKVWPSSPSVDPSYNDAMVFGYYGTSAFSSFNSLNYVKFLMAVDAISQENAVAESIWTRGLLAHPLLSTFACEKYVLTKDPEPFKAANYYELVRSYGDIHVFRNQLFVPLGITFSYYISEDAFLKLLSDGAKPLALLHSVVLSDNEMASGEGLSQLHGEELKRRMMEVPLPQIVAERRNSALHIRSLSQTRIEGAVRVEGKSILVLQTPFDPGWHAFVDGHPAPTLRVDAGLLGVVLESGEHNVELRYRPPLLYAGAAMTLMSLGILFWGLWTWPRIRVPQ